MLPNFFREWSGKIKKLKKEYGRFLLGIEFERTLYYMCEIRSKTIEKFSLTKKISLALQLMGFAYWDAKEILPVYLQKILHELNEKRHWFQKKNISFHSIWHFLTFSYVKNKLCENAEQSKLLQRLHINSLPL